ncbi:hypothetical protein Dimus_009130 [Dionaea muscipula]
MPSLLQSLCVIFFAYELRHLRNGKEKEKDPKQICMQNEFLNAEMKEVSWSLPSAVLFLYVGSLIFHLHCKIISIICYLYKVKYGDSETAPSRRSKKITLEKLITEEAARENYVRRRFLLHLNLQIMPLRTKLLLVGMS